MVSELLRRLAARSGLRTAAINTFWLFADRLTRSAVDLGLSMLMAQQLGIEAFGGFAWAFSVVLILQSLVGLGLDAVALKEIVARPSMQSAIVGSVFVLRMATGIIVLSAVAVVYAGRPYAIELESTLTVLLSAMLIPQCATAFDVWFVAQTRSKDVLLPRFVAFAISLPMKLLVLIVWHDLSLFALTMVGEACLSAVMAYFTYRAQNVDSPKLRFSRPIAIDLLRQSLPLLGLGFFTVLQARVDQIILGHLLGGATLGRYALALRVIELAAGIPAVIMASVSPALAHAHIRDPRLFCNRVLNSYRLMIIVSVALSAPILCAAWAIQAVDRDAFDLAVVVLLAALTPRLVLAAMGLVKTQYLTNERLLHWGLVSAMIGALLNLVGTSILIPMFGIFGAVVASSFSFLLQIVLLDGFYPKTRENFFLMLRGLFSFWKFRIT